MKVKTEIEVTKEQLEDLLCSAFEGGSNYWIDYAKWHEANGTRAEYIFEVPFTPNNYVEILPIEEEKSVQLTYDSLKKGLDIMAEKYPHHMSNLISDNADAETGDVYLQCCVFGEAIYG